MIEPGQTAPDFELPDQDGTPVRLSDLRGGLVVLYFYPKADTRTTVSSMHGRRRDYQQARPRRVPRARVLLLRGADRLAVAGPHRLRAGRVPADRQPRYRTPRGVRLDRDHRALALPKSAVDVQRLRALAGMEACR